MEKKYCFTEEEMLDLIGSTDSVMMKNLVKIPNASKELKAKIYCAQPNLVNWLGCSDPFIRRELSKKGKWQFHFLKNPTEEEQLLAIEADRFSFSEIENPTLKVRRQALKNDPENIRYIKEPTAEEINLILDLKGWKEIEYFGKYLNEEQQERFLDLHPKAWHVISYFKDPSPAIRLKVLQRKGWAITEIENPTEEECLIALEDILFNQEHNDYFSKVLKQNSNKILTLFYKDIFKRTCSWSFHKKASELIKKFRKQQKEQV